MGLFTGDMLMPFIACEIYKNDIFALDVNGDFWRFELEYVDQQVVIQKLADNDDRYYSIIELLRAKANLYK